MKAMRYRLGKKRVINRLIYFVLLLMSINLIAVDTFAKDTQADSITNTIAIKTKKVDYDNRCLYADINIRLKLDSNTESLYLILPIDETPGMRFKKGRNSNRTILSGFLGGSSYYIIQFLPDKESGEVSLSLENVRFTLFEPLDDVSFGSYELCFGKTKEDMPNYINNYIKIDEIRIIDKNISSSIPNVLYQENTLVFGSDAENISVSIIRVENILDIGLRDVLSILAVILIAVVLCFGPAKNKILWYVKEHMEYKRLIFAITLIACVFIVLGFPIAIFLLKLYKDATIIVSYVSGVSSTITIGGAVLNLTKKDKSKENVEDQVLEGESIEDPVEKKEDENNNAASTENYETEEKANLE